MTQEFMVQEKANLVEIVTVLFKYKKEITGIFFAIVFVVTVVSLLWPRSYETSSDVLIQFGREYVDRPNVANTPNQPINESLQVSTSEIVNSEIAIMQSYDIAEQVVSTIGVEKMFPGLKDSERSFLEKIGVREKVPALQKAASRFQQNVKIGVKLLKNVRSNVIEIKYESRNPVMAARAINLLVNLYKEKHLEVYSGPRSAFLSNQLAEFKQKMEQSADELQAFKHEKSAFDLPAQRTSHINQLEALEGALRASTTAVASLRGRLSSNHSQLKQIMSDKTLYTASGMDSILSNANNQLLALESKELNLLQKYKPDNPFVVDVRREIQNTRDFIKNQEMAISNKVKTGNPLFQGVKVDANKSESELVSELAKQKTIRVQIQDVLKELQDIDMNEKRLRELTRNFEINEANYKSYRTKYEESLIYSEMYKQTISNVSVIQEAPVNNAPKWPKKVLNVLLGIAFGSACGIGYAFFAETYSQGISSSENVERRLGLPVLAAIPHQQK
ncbi:MAG: hypothetical protein HQK99_10215 [Nitrospirae bacterium]|nr:hypothetical protein [Nitrospirota bacterium]